MPSTEQTPRLVSHHVKLEILKKRVSSFMDSLSLRKEKTGLLCPAHGARFGCKVDKISEILVPCCCWKPPLGCRAGVCSIGSQARAPGRNCALFVTSGLQI